jgi:hypothetical protein
MWSELDEGAALFSDFWNAPIDRICIENPVMHRHAKERIANYADFAQSIQPWQFGHGETKRTCFWLKNLPPLKPTNVVEGRENRVHRMPPSRDRWKERSRFFDGVAAAMADQWGELGQFSPDAANTPLMPHNTPASHANRLLRQREVSGQGVLDL